MQKSVGYCGSIEYFAISNYVCMCGDGVQKKKINQTWFILTNI